MKTNPYPEMVEDGVSGTMVPNREHQAWEEGFKAAQLAACKPAFAALQAENEKLKARIKELEAPKNRPKIVCLCGSTRFTPLMLMMSWEYARQGIVALGWSVRPTAEGEPTDHLAEREGLQAVFDEVHKRKIDLADEVFILNVDGYIGESTRSELEYAKAHGKAIRFLESVSGQPEGENGDKL